MRVVSDVYKREIKANGFHTKGLDFEFDQNGQMIVHLVNAENKSSFYTGSPFNIDHFLNSHQQEIWEKTGFSRNRPTLDQFLKFIQVLHVCLPMFSVML
jgi:hypothetical protein